MDLFATGGNERYFILYQKIIAMPDTVGPTMFADCDDILTVQDVQKLPGISRKRVYELIEDKAYIIPNYT